MVSPILEGRKEEAYPAVLLSIPPRRHLTERYRRAHLGGDQSNFIIWRDPTNRR